MHSISITHTHTCMNMSIFYTDMALFYVVQKNLFVEYKKMCIIEFSSLLTVSFDQTWNSFLREKCTITITSIEYVWCKSRHLQHRERNRRARTHCAVQCSITGKMCTTQSIYLHIFARNTYIHLYIVTIVDEVENEKKKKRNKLAEAYFSHFFYCNNALW